jgi:uncharacterized integral membrane protein
MATEKNLLAFLDSVKGAAGVPADIQDRAKNLSAEITDGPALRSDVWIYRAVVVILGLAVLVTTFGGIGLAFLGNAQNYKLPAEIVAIGSAAVGALAGLLAPSPRDKQ